MMKEDITQLEQTETEDQQSCGLVMKEDITQRAAGGIHREPSCGLVMKEDITQHALQDRRFHQVVVW